MDAKGAGMPTTAGMPAARKIPATEVMMTVGSNSQDFTKIHD
jgi:hypothetical protein